MVSTVKGARTSTPGIVAVISVLVSVLISGCSDGGHVDGLRTCGTSPVTSSETPQNLVLTLAAPRSAPSGTWLHPTITIQVRGSSVPRAYGFAGAPVTDVVRGGHIVGAFSGDIAGTGIGLRIGNQPVRMDGGAVLLSGCAANPVEFTNPDATRKPLPPGKYQLVASIHLDKNRGRAVLASQPVDITIT